MDFVILFSLLYSRMDNSYEWIPIDRPVTESESSFRVLFEARCKSYLLHFRTPELSESITFVEPIRYDVIHREVVYLTNDDDQRNPNHVHPWVELQKIYPDGHYGCVSPPHSQSLSLEDRLHRLQLICSALSTLSRDAIYHKSKPMNRQQINMDKEYKYNATYVLWMYYLCYLLLLIGLFYYVYYRPTMTFQLLCLIFVLLGILLLFL